MKKRGIALVLALCMALTLATVPAAAASTTYAVQFYPNYDGKDPTIKTVTVGSTYPLTNLSRTGYLFDGWYTASTGGTKITANTVVPEYGPTKLYAHWAPQYTITFSANGGSGNASVKTGADGRLLSRPADPTRAGYTFLGWFTDPVDGTQINVDDVFIQDTIVYAHWKAGGYSITFYPNGGLPDTPVTLTTGTDGRLTAQPFTPAQDGYVFDGWYTKDETTGALAALVTSGTVFSKDTDVYANWRADSLPGAQEQKYLIKFDPNGGTLTDAGAGTAYTSGGRLTSLPSVYTRAGYSFAGWYTASAGGAQVTTDTVFTGNATVYAHWSTGAYTVTFNPNGGALSGWETSLKTEGGMLSSLPPAPTRTGYTFSGWYTAPSGGIEITAAYTDPNDVVWPGTVFTADTTVYAQWRTDAYTITFNPNGGTLNGGTTTLTTESGGILTSSLPSVFPRDGYEFTGWYTASSGGIKIESGAQFTANATLYAHWVKTGAEGKSYTVTFNSNGGLPSTAVTRKTGTNGVLAESTPNDPARYGYTFEGWYTASSGGSKVEPATAVFSANTTLYARWKLINYTITFNPNGGTLAAGSSTRETNDAGQLASTPFDPTWTGHIFTGWYTAPTGGVRITTETAFTANATVYAHWLERSTTGGAQFSICFNANGGTLTGGYTPMPGDADAQLTWISTDADGKLPQLPTAVRSKYLFVGWYNGTELVTKDTVFTGDATVYAYWSSTDGASGSGAPSGSGSAASDRGYDVYYPEFVTGGAVEIKPDGKILQGETVTVDITAGKSYQLTALNVTDGAGKQVAVTRTGSARYTFAMPAANVTIVPIFSAAESQSSQGYTYFSDVGSGDYCYDSVQWAVQNGIAAGYSSGSAYVFAPNDACTNAHILTFLWRWAGCPAPTVANPFSNVSGSEYYADAAIWACEQGMISGGAFNADAPCTRASAVKYLWQYAGSPAMSVSGRFADVSSGADYAQAVEWALRNGVTGGTGADTFSPSTLCTRGHIVTFLYRMRG